MEHLKMHPHFFGTIDTIIFHHLHKIEMTYDKVEVPFYQYKQHANYLQLIYAN